MINDDLQTEIMELEQELRDLKQIQGVLRTAMAYSYSGTFGSSAARVTLEITYADGDAPIVMSWLGTRYLTPLKIVGNKQKIHLAIYTTGVRITFYSTREIKSVVRL
mgnify:CR=1 FL=1